MKKNTHIKKVILVIAFVILLLLGVGITVYPELSARYTESVRSEIQTAYHQVVEDPSQQKRLHELKQAAMDYNRKLFLGDISPLEPAANGYYDQLTMENSNIMCFIRIPCIDVELPVYHGIGSEELNRGAGHMPQTSLPVGGVNTHAVISAHSGMASNAMFSDLELLKVGDVLYIDVLDETLTYQVYAIPEPVLPHEVESILIQGGNDLLTLVTCWPFGVNTHRLLVHCKRIETPEEPEKEIAAIEVEREDVQSVYAAQYRKNLTIGMSAAVLILIAAIIVVIFKHRRNRSDFA